MAGAIVVSFNLAFTPSYTGASQVSLPLTNLAVTVSGSNFKRETQTIPTTAGGTEIDVSALTVPRWCAIINRDPTNYVQILSAVSGTVIARLLPGEGMLLPLDPTVTAPAALAHTASVQIEVLVIEN